MNLSVLKTFVAVAEKQNLSLAAQEIHVTQPAISKQLGNLEDYFEVALVERHGRGIKLTTAGDVLYRYAVNMLSLMQEAEVALRELSTTLKGKLTIYASTIPGHYILPLIISAFKKINPDVTISLQIADSKIVMQNILEETANLGAVGVLPGNRRIDGIKFFSDELVLIVPAGHSFAAQTEVSVQSLAGEPLVWREKGSGTRDVVEEKFTKAGLSLSRLNISMELGSTESIITAVEAGAGISIVSRWSVQKELALGKIVALNIKEISMSRDLYLIYPRRKTKNRLTAAFLDFALKKEFPGDSMAANPGNKILRAPEQLL